MTEKSCGAVVCRQTDGQTEFLAIQSQRNGTWGFPKGHMEAGETEVDTARREVCEEAGLTIELTDGFRTEVEYPLANGNRKIVVFFLATAPGQDVRMKPDEVQEYRWLPYEPMLELLTYDNMKNVLKRAQEFLRQHR